MNIECYLMGVINKTPVTRIKSITLSNNGIRNSRLFEEKRTKRTSHLSRHSKSIENRHPLANSMTSSAIFTKRAESFPPSCAFSTFAPDCATQRKYSQPNADLLFKAMRARASEQASKNESR